MAQFTAPHEPSRREFVSQGTASLLTAAEYARVHGANERVGIGFIGYGLIGKRHVLDFRAQADADLVAVAETHRDRILEAKDAIGGSVRGFADFRRLLDDRNVHVVVVSTPDHWHALMTMMACAAGKDVYVEKPLTLFVREGRWMINVARRAKRIVQVGTQQRSGKHYQRAKALIQSGHIGTVCSIRMHAFRNIMPGYGAPADQDPPPWLDWEMWQGPAPARKYNPNRGIYHFRWFWDYSGGQMTNLGQHSLDIAHWFLDLARPTTVVSMGGRFCLRDNGETPDTQDAVIAYPNLTVTWSHRETSRGVVSNQSVEFCGIKGTLSIGRSGFAVNADPRLPPERTIPRFDDKPPAREGERPAAALWTQPLQDKTGDSREQFRLHVRNFLDCVKSRQQPIADLESGHRVASVCHLANISLRLGRMIRWDAEAERVRDDPEANQMLVRPYRPPWDKVLESLRVE